MRNTNYHFLSIKFIAFTFVWLLFFICVKAQKQDSTTVPIHILNTVYYEHVTTDTGEINKLVGDVQLEHNGTLMYCDSAYLNLSTNYLEAFDNVHIVQPGGTDVTSDYLRYTGNNHLAFLSGNCNLTDGKNSLECEELNYNLTTKIAEYFNGGTLHNDGTVVTSNYGLYNINSKESRFTEHVTIDDPEYHITSSDIGYNTGTKLAQFFGPSVVVNDKSTLRTRSGTWDGLNQVAHFVKRSSLVSGAQYIEADTMDYSKPTGFGNAKGKVVAIDTAQKTTLYCGYAQYNEITEQLYAFIKPVMRKMTGSDSLFIRADTFFSAPVTPKIDSARLRSVDSLKAAKNKGKKMSGKDAGVSLNKKKRSQDTTTAALPPLSNAAATDTILQITDSTRLPSTDSLVNEPAATTIDSGARKKPVAEDSITSDATETPDTVVAGSPLLKTIQEKDTIISTKTAKAEDSVAYKPMLKNGVSTGKKTAATEALAGKKVKPDDSTAFLGKEDFLLNPDSNAAAHKDDSSKRYFIAYNHVLIFSDSLQGKCDSLSYSQRDSVMRLMNTPIVWSRKSQITGDTILLYMDSSKLRKMYVPYDAFMISQSGPEKAKLYDQVQGRTLTGNLKNNTITDIIVEPEAETIYYTKDDAGAYLGPVEVSGLRMRILFNDQKIHRILYESDVKQKITPMLQADIDALKLSRFQWHEDKRPKTLEELFK